MLKHPLVVGRVIMQNDYYVEAKEAEKLERRNKEMLLDFGYVLSYVQANYPNNHTLINMIQNAIKKAEDV